MRAGGRGVLTTLMCTCAEFSQATMTITNVFDQMKPTQDQQIIAPYLLKCALQNQAAFELRMVHIKRHAFARQVVPI
jgi:hypothetical protein